LHDEESKDMQFGKTRLDAQDSESENYIQKSYNNYYTSSDNYESENYS